MGKELPASRRGSERSAPSKLRGGRQKEGGGGPPHCGDCVDDVVTHEGPAGDDWRRRPARMNRPFGGGMALGALPTRLHGGAKPRIGHGANYSTASDGPRHVEWPSTQHRQAGHRQRATRHGQGAGHGDPARHPRFQRLPMHDVPRRAAKPRADFRCPRVGRRSRQRASGYSHRPTIWPKHCCERREAKHATIGQHLYGVARAALGHGARGPFAFSACPDAREHAARHEVAHEQRSPSGACRRCDRPQSDGRPRARDREGARAPRGTGNRHRDQRTHCNNAKWCHVPVSRRSRSVLGTRRVVRRGIKRITHAIAKRGRGRLMHLFTSAPHRREKPSVMQRQHATRWTAREMDAHALGLSSTQLVIEIGEQERLRVAAGHVVRLSSLKTGARYQFGGEWATAHDTPVSPSAKLSGT